MPKPPTTGPAKHCFHIARTARRTGSNRHHFAAAANVERLSMVFSDLPSPAEASRQK
jgi:hypothetical protein